MAMDQLAQIQSPVQQKRVQYRFFSQIMVIDDDPELLEELENFLSFNYDVETLLDSTQAFDRVCDLMPDLIIMDMKMFPKTGFQLAYEFRNHEPTKTIPIIAITGVFIEEEHALMMKLSGMKRIFIKPFNLNQLLSEIEKTIEESRPHLT